MCRCLAARQRLENMSFQDSLEALLQVARRSPYPGEGGADALREWGLTDAEITRFQ